MGLIKECLKKVRDHLYRNFITEYIVPVKDQVILDSKPDFSDNTYALYLEMLKNDYQKKYKIIWFVNGDIPEKYFREDITYFNTEKKGLFNILKTQYIVNSSKFIITCNRFYHRKTKRQTIIYLNHGMPIKDCSKLKMKFGDVDVSLSTSKYFIKSLSESLYTDEDKFIVFQLPRNDQLLQKEKNVKKIMGLEKQKIIVWLPTFRKYEDGIRVDSSFEMPLGVPIVYNMNDMNKLNDYLKKKKITLILKPHFATKMDELKATEFSNFKILTNDDLDKKDLTLYEFLSGTDALLTDYSSVYYDYLITGKPIGLTLDDYKNYKEETGFAIDYEKIVKGHYIYNFEDLREFIDDLFEEKDQFKEDRELVLKKLKYDTDGNFSKKLFEYIRDNFNF